MYIKSAEITNIRSIENFYIEFEKPAGWHVLIGDNGAGKSTIIRSIALALVGPDEALGLRADWKDWLSNDKQEGRVELQIEQSEIDENTENNSVVAQCIPNIIVFERNDSFTYLWSNKNVKYLLEPTKYNWSNLYGWFSVAYGPYRRFSGGDPELSKIFSNQPKLGAHLSVFGENVALTEPIEWLVKLNYQAIEKLKDNILKVILQNNKQSVTSSNQYVPAQGSYSKNTTIISEANSNIEINLEDIISIDEFKLSDSTIIDNLKKLINSPDFLPNNTKLERISSEGVFFIDGSENLITVNQLSDGYRSILSLTFELIRQLIRVYGEDAVFKNIRENTEDRMNIDLPGVVLIDEIDAHLHPTWQTRIGQWFLKYFPNIQFIVTTHSPLVCRAAEKGTIWKLAAPGSSEKSEQVTGIDRDRLIYGNVLDAYGTEAFGDDVSLPKESEKMLKELADLNKKSFKGTISDGEKRRMNDLKQILPTS